MFFGSTFIEQDGGCLRCHGRSVRPVYDESLQEDDEVDIYPFYVVTEKPTFNGGDSNNFAKWIALHLTYPEEAKKKGLTGRVWLSFDIDKDGTLTNVRVLRSVHKILDDEAIRVVSSSPKWEPGTMYGKPIKVTFSMPVIFELR